MNAKALAGTFFLFTLLFLNAAGQTPDPMFRVVRIPVKAGVSKEVINQKLIAAASRENVRKIIRTTLQGRQDITIVVRVRKTDGQFDFWTINTDNNKETETDFTLLRSKFTESDRIYRLQELKEMLKDTVFVMDTLALQLALQDVDLSNNGYFLYGRCQPGSGYVSVPLRPSADGSLLITRQVFASLPSCGDFYHTVSLRNEASGERQLAEFVLFFPNEDQKEMLRELATQLKMEKSVPDARAIADYLSAYIRQNYGDISYKQLTHWLQSVN